MRFQVLVMMGAVLLASGCTSGPGLQLAQWMHLAPATETPTTAPAGEAVAGDPDSYILTVELKVASIEVPVGTASGSEKIWSYLDEERSRAVRSATMSQNGIRLGVASKDTWPDLVRILQDMTGRKMNDRFLRTVPSQPVSLVLLPDQAAQTIFTIYADRTTSGNKYPPGDNLLVLNFSMDESNCNKLILTGVPQIRTKEKFTHVVQVPGMGQSVVAEPDLLSFAPCTFQLTLSPQEILVIGPGAESRRAFSVGRHFLVHIKDGLECETVLVIVPEVKKVQYKPNPLGGMAEATTGR